MDGYRRIAKDRVDIGAYEFEAYEFDTERLTKEWVMANLFLGEKIKMDGKQFIVNEIFSNINGFYAAGLIYYVEREPQEAMLVFRGSDDALDWIFANTHIGGIGYNQYMVARTDVLNWAERNTQGVALTLTGHSLGGALAQWFAVDLQGDRLKEVETFNSPGISRFHANQFNQGTTKVTHHIVRGDIVSLAGEAFIAGTNFLYTVNAGVFDLIGRHAVVWDLKELLGTPISTASLNSPYFNFFPLLPAILMRGNVEGVRTYLGMATYSTGVLVNISNNPIQFINNPGAHIANGINLLWNRTFGNLFSSSEALSPLSALNSSEVGEYLLLFDFDGTLGADHKGTIILGFPAGLRV